MGLTGMAVWALVAIGGGGFGSSNLTALPKFDTRLDCEVTRIDYQRKIRSVKFACVNEKQGLVITKKQAGQLKRGDIIIRNDDFYYVVGVKPSVSGRLIVAYEKNGNIPSNFEVDQDVQLAVVGE